MFFCISCTKKLSTYMYLESDTANGNFEFGITMFIAVFLNLCETAAQ